MIILSIETSCDETGLALLEAEGKLKSNVLPRFRVIRSVLASQIAIHRPFGGVVPNLAKREHQKNLPILFNKLFPTPQTLKPINCVAVTVGPGLEPALWTGIEFAKAKAKQLKKSLVGVNHLEGHLYSFLLAGQKKAVKTKPEPRNPKRIFPAVALLVSGGHTILLSLTDLTARKKLGETRDDAAGECFDKVARLLKLPYPGGPEIQKLASRGKTTIPFPRPMLHQKNYDFSFSGLKTSVLYYLRDNKKANKADVAASVEEAIVDVLVTKTMRAARETSARSVLLSGGVAANKTLRDRFKKLTKKEGMKFFVPEFEYNTDNAAMIGVAGYINVLRNKKYQLKARGDMNI